MDGALRDAVIKVGGKWPVIGGTVAVVAFLVWLAYKAWEDKSHEIAYFLGIVAAVFAIGGFLLLDKAEAACIDLYHSDRPEYARTNCEMLVDCEKSFGSC